MQGGYREDPEGASPKGLSTQSELTYSGTHRGLIQQPIRLRVKLLRLNRERERREHYPCANTKGTKEKGRYKRVFGSIRHRSSKRNLWFVRTSQSPLVRTGVGLGIPSLRAGCVVAT